LIYFGSDPNFAKIYPAELKHTQTPSGVPPHALLLKPDTIVILIRNLNPKNCATELE
jgi:hypothetical protein